MKSSYVLLPDELHRFLKVLAAKRGCTMAALFILAVRELLATGEEGLTEIDTSFERVQRDPVSS